MLPVRVPPFPGLGTSVRSLQPWLSLGCRTSSLCPPSVTSAQLWSPTFSQWCFLKHQSSTNFTVYIQPVKAWGKRHVKYPKLFNYLIIKQWFLYSFQHEIIKNSAPLHSGKCWPGAQLAAELCSARRYSPPASARCSPSEAREVDKQDQRKDCRRLINKRRGLFGLELRNSMQT